MIHLRCCDGCGKQTEETNQSSCIASHLDLSRYDLKTTGCFDDFFYCEDCLNHLGFCKNCQKEIPDKTQKLIVDYFNTRNK